MRKILSFFLALAMIVASLSFVDVSQVNAADTADTMIEVYEVSLLNYMNSLGGKELSGTVVVQDEDYGTFNTVGDSLRSSYTFYTKDGDWCITATSSGSSITLTSYSYQGDDLTVQCDIPDFINFNFVSAKDKVEDVCTITLGAFRGTIISIGTAFNSSYNASTCTSMDVAVPKRVTTIDSKAFCDNTRLTSVEFRGDIQSIGTSAFEGCTRLKTLDLMGVFETVATNTIPDRCFYKCSSLENIAIPSTILNIGKEAFYQCDKIDYLILSDSIKTIGNNAFAMCSNLRYLYIASKYSDWSNIVSSTELGKLVTESDSSNLVVSKKGNTASVGSYIYSAGDYSVISNVDIDVDSVSVKKDGVAVPVKEFLSTTYGYATKGVYFSISTADKGEYVVTAKDIVGNEFTKTFSYVSDVQDITPPQIVISGKGTDGFYQSVDITYKDNETYVGTVEFDGVVYSGDKITCDTEGVHTVTVKDAFGNTASKVFMVDNTAPVVKGVDNNGQYNTGKKVTITENGSGIKSVVLDGKDLGNVTTATISDTGSHTLVVTDNALNSVTYKFLIDMVGPSLRGVVDGGIYSKNVSMDVTSSCGISSITVTHSVGSMKDAYTVSNGAVLSKEGKYTIELKDILGNTKRYSVIIDKIAPKIEGASNGKYYKSNTLSIKIADDNFDTATLNGTTVSKSVSIKNDGKYKLVAKDKAGNQTTITFYKDTTTPRVNIKNGKASRKALTVSVSDKTSGIKSIKLNNKTKKNKSVIKKQGKYKLVVTDKAGNKTTVNFSIDKTKPTCSIKNGSTVKAGKTLKVADKISGVKSIKLNGKSIKNKYVLRKAGSYRLVVKDNAGNSRTVRFKVVK